MNKKWLIITGLGAMTLTTLIIGLVLIYKRSVGLDESQTIWIATKSINQIMQLTGEDVHVPLYNSLVHLIIQGGGNNIRYVRMLSLGFLIAAVPAMYYLAKENANTKTAILACGLMLFSPFVLWYSTQARMYSLLMFITILNNLFFLRMVKSKAKRAKLNYFLSGMVGIFSHYFFWFSLMTQGAYLVLKFIKDKQKFPQKVWLAFGATLMGLVVIFLPWIGYVLSLGGASNTQPLIQRPSSYNVMVALVNFFFGFQEITLQNVLVSLWPLSAILLLVAFGKRNKTKNTAIDYFTLAAILPIITIFVMSFVRPIFLSRYLIFVVPSWMIVLGWILADQRRKMALGLTALLIAAMSGLMLNQTVSAATPVKENYSQVAEYLKDKATVEDVVAVTAPFTIYPIEYSYQGGARLATVPEWDRYVSGGIPQYDEAKMKTQIEGYKKVYQNLFLVFSYDQGYGDSILNYMDHNYQMVDKKEFPTSIEVREYRLRY